MNKFQLAEEIIVDEKQRPMRLSTSYCGAGQFATVVGWGYLHDGGGTTAKLQKAPVITLSNPECIRRLPYPIGQHQICGFYKNGVGFCDVSICLISNYDKFCLVRIIK